MAEFIGNAVIGMAAFVGFALAYSWAADRWRRFGAAAELATMALFVGSPVWIWVASLVIVDDPEPAKVIVGAVLAIGFVALMVAMTAGDVRQKWRDMRRK
jgi:hypothetical protein